MLSARLLKFTFYHALIIMLYSKCKFAFSGWEDVPHQDLNFVQNVFQFIPADDQKLAYDHFFQKLGKYS